MRIIVAAPIAALLLASCATAPIAPLPLPDESDRAELLIFRPFVLFGAAVPVPVGLGPGTDVFVSLQSSEYVVAAVSARTSAIAVRNSYPEQSALELNLVAGDRTCIRVWVLGSLILPVNCLQTVSCPSAAELAMYKQVSIEYRLPWPAGR